MTPRTVTNYTLTPDDFLSREERTALITTCRQRAEHDLAEGRRAWPVRYMLVDLALYSGLRVFEMAALRVGDVRLSAVDPYIHVRHGKGNRERVVYIDTALADHLREFIAYKRTTLFEPTDATSVLFAGRDWAQSPPITLQKSFKRAVEESGIRTTISIHKARHTYATYLLHDTGNLRYVMRQLGHTDIGMTSLYAGILPEENGRLANKIVRED